MSAAESSTKQILESEDLKRKRVMDDDHDLDATISDDIETIMRALQRIKANAQKDFQNKNESQQDGQNKEMIPSVTSDIKSRLDEFKSEVEKGRPSFDKALSEGSKEYQSLMKTEVAKFQEVYENFFKEKAAYLQALKDVISKYEEEKEKLFVRYEKLMSTNNSFLISNSIYGQNIKHKSSKLFSGKKKEKALLSEYGKTNAPRIAQLEESLKKKKQGKRNRRIVQLEEIPEEEETQDDKTFSILRKNEETISSVDSDIKSSLDELKSKLENVRQSFAEALSKSSKENLLKTEAAKFQEVCVKFSNKKAARLQAVKDVKSKYIGWTERQHLTYNQLRKKESDLLSKHVKENAARIAQLEESPKKKKKWDDKIFSTSTKNPHFLEMIQMRDSPKILAFLYFIILQS